MKTVVGKVVSDKMAGMAVVEVNRWVPHPMYQKRVRKTTKYHAENRAGAKMGDMVSLRETRPLSATKRWRVTKVVNTHGPA